MDEKDEKILLELLKNSKLSTQEISKRTLIPVTTVHNRIKKLEKHGIIKNYTLTLDYSKLGKNLAAYILIAVDYKYLKEIKSTQHELAKKLRCHPSVEEADMITGGNDIIIKVRAKDMKEIDYFVTTYLRNVHGVDRTQTMFILHEIE